MVEKRMDRSFLRIFESYGYSKEAVTNKNIFDQLDDCDRTTSRVSKKLNESNIKKTTTRCINESMFGGKPLTKEQLVKKMNGNIETNESLADGYVISYEEKLIDKLITYMIEHFGISNEKAQEICKEIGMKAEDIAGLFGLNK